MPECCSCAIAHARRGGQLLLWSLLRSSLPEHLQHLGRSIGAIASVQQVLCVGHDKSARLVSSEERTHFKSRTGVNRTDARLAVTAIIFMHTTVYLTHILFTQSRAECTLGLKEGGLAKKHSLRSLAFLAKYLPKPGLQRPGPPRYTPPTPAGRA